MTKSDKNWIFSLVSVFLFTLVLGIIVKSTFNDSGLLHINEFKDLNDHEIIITSPLGSDNEEIIYENYAKNIESISDVLSNSPIIAVVKPTGKLYSGEGSLGQEFIVKNIIKGSLTEGDYSVVYSEYGFDLNSEDQIRYHDMTNLMNPSSEYLIFLEESQLNAYTNENNFRVVFPPSYFNLSKTESQVITQFDDKWQTYEDSEFFVSTPRVLDQVYRLKEIILEQYISKN